jgi:hypothetical protein
MKGRVFHNHNGWFYEEQLFKANHKLDFVMSAKCHINKEEGE